VLYIGQLPVSFHKSLIKEVHSRDDREAAKEGDIVRSWDYVSVVNSDTLPLAFTDPLRHRSDVLADDVVEALNLRPGQDSLAAILAALADRDATGAGVDPRVLAFWTAVNREPPQGVTALVGGEEGNRVAKPTMGKTPAAVEGLPPSLQEGQAVFWRYSAQIFAALMHFSLAGGFSSPNLSAVMNETGYLTSAVKDATYKRLLETTLMVLDVMSDMTIGSGRGWKSALRVRLLHAQVRRRIAMRKGKLGTYDYEKSGVPINQADLATVLGSFMIAPLWAMRRCGIHVTAHEASSYQAAWRHVGYYLGIDSDLLERCYGRSFATAETTFAALSFENFPSTPPCDGFTTPTYRILSAVADRHPRFTPVGFHCEYSRLVLGSRLADGLALPRGTLRERGAVWMDVAIGWCLVHFGHVWRAGWEMERQRLFASIVEMLVVAQLGERRSVFAWREEAVWADVLTKDEGEDSGIPMGAAVAVEIKSRVHRLLTEMVVVVAGVAVTGLAIMVAAIWRF
ncbi:hypothetical protein HKX48_000758, partial [Thoreauomyces humboldtii]